MVLCVCVIINDKNKEFSWKYCKQASITFYCLEMFIAMVDWEDYVGIRPNKKKKFCFMFSAHLIFITRFLILFQFYFNFLLLKFCHPYLLNKHKNVFENWKCIPHWILKLPRDMRHTIFFFFFFAYGAFYCL